VVAAPRSLPSEVRFTFRRPLLRGLLFSDSGLSDGLTTIDGATSNPSAIQHLLVISDLMPLPPLALDSATIRAGGGGSLVA
jgi:hypothetical protein